MLALFKSRPAFGLALGIALVAAAILRVPQAASALIGATPAQPQHCPVVEVALDEGYGLTRTEFRPTCR